MEKSQKATKSRRKGMSSFKRNVKKTEDSNHRSIPGVKPWLNCGLGIVSCGNRELDELIGGGVPLGTLTLLATDTISNYGQTFLSYFAAEGISVGHSVLILTSDDLNLEKFSSSLPYNQHMSSSTVHKQPEEENSSVNLDSELKLAASYRKYIEAKIEEKKAREKSAHSESIITTSGLPVQYCYSYDLSRSMQLEVLTTNPPSILSSENLVSSHIPNESSSSSAYSRLQRVLDSFIVRLQEFVSEVEQRGTAGRVCLPDLSDLLLLSIDPDRSNDERVSGRALLRFILQVKHVVRTSRVAVWIGLPPSYTSPHTLQKVSDLCDAYFAVESFVGQQDSVPYEFKEFCGFFYIHKLSTLGSLCAFRAPGHKFGLKRDRRKLHVEPLHLPPEESRATASATESDASKMKQLAMSSSSSSSAMKGLGPVTENKVEAQRHNAGRPIGYEASPLTTDASFSSPTQTTIIPGEVTRETQSLSGRTPAERAAAIAAKLASNAPKGSSVSISSVNHKKNSSQKSSQASSLLCSPKSELNTADGELDF